MDLQRDWAWHPGVMALSGTSPFLDRDGRKSCRNCPLTHEWQQTPPPSMRATRWLLSFLSTLRDRCRDGTAE